jgi:hypothetical protein
MEYRAWRFIDAGMLAIDRSSKQSRLSGASGRK